MSCLPCPIMTTNPFRNGSVLETRERLHIHKIHSGVSLLATWMWSRNEPRTTLQTPDLSCMYAISSTTSWGKHLDKTLIATMRWCLSPAFASKLGIASSSLLGAICSGSKSAISMNSHDQIQSANLAGTGWSPSPMKTPPSSGTDRHGGDRLRRHWIRRSATNSCWLVELCTPGHNAWLVEPRVPNQIGCTLVEWCAPNQVGWRLVELRAPNQLSWYARRLNAVRW